MDIKKLQAAKPLLYIGGAFLGYKFVLKPLFDKFGLTKSTDSTALDENSKLPAWDIKFWKQALAQKKILPAFVKAVNVNAAKNIEDAFGFWNDDETAVFTEIKKAGTQAELSVISELYLNKYKKNLFERLRDKLSEGEMTNIATFVKALPLYKAKTITGFPTVW